MTGDNIIVLSHISRAALDAWWSCVIYQTSPTQRRSQILLTHHQACKRFINTCLRNYEISFSTHSAKDRFSSRMSFLIDFPSRMRAFNTILRSNTFALATATAHYKISSFNSSVSSSSSAVPLPSRAIRSKFEGVVKSRVADVVDRRIFLLLFSRFLSRTPRDRRRSAIL